MPSASSSGTWIAAEPSLLRAPPSRVIHQDTAHHARRDREEMSAVRPLRIVLAAEPEVDLMDEGSTLECVAVAFASQMVMGQPPQSYR